MTGLSDVELELDDLLLHLLKTLPKADLRYLRVILFASKGIASKIETAKSYTQSEHGKIIPLPMMLWVDVTHLDLNHFDNKSLF